ncbi:MAG: ankyrin repeat domain-containing protein [bacterium]|nr:ankyrin repeat domain-containing protein [bacterium]
MKPASETTMKKLSLEEKERLSRLLWHEVHEGAYSSLVERCLKEGADLDYAKNEFGRTALMKAAYWGLEEIVKLLVEAGADINAQDEKGETALDMSRTRAKVVEFLKTKGAKEGSELP